MSVVFLNTADSARFEPSAYCGSGLFHGVGDAQTLVQPCHDRGGHDVPGSLDTHVQALVADAGGLICCHDEILAVLPILPLQAAGNHPLATSGQQTARVLDDLVDGLLARRGGFQAGAAVQRGWERSR